MKNTREWKPGERWDELEMLRKEYPTFRLFLYDVMTSLLGFNCSDIQIDIADYLEHGPLYRMIQAQRGQAKTTITAAYAVWRIIHEPNTRIVIYSAGGDQAAEIAGWVIQIIRGMDILECLRPDKSAGDRESIDSYDINNELKGPEKSASITCRGITANTQGLRADVFIADDIESGKNSQTAGQRDRLRHLTLDFASICSNGDIIYLGTPQSVDSIYNGLPSRGYSIRVWPGRYPTADEEKNYGAHLAPLIARRMRDDPSLRTGGGPSGQRGRPVDPLLMSEATLTKKEVDQGAAYFQLQHMLDTRLSDADRFPLKVKNLLMMQISRETAPLEMFVQRSNATLMERPADWPITDELYRVSSFGQELGPFSSCHMYVDPAGGGSNGDETAYAVTKFLGGRVFLVDIGAVPGGFETASLKMLTDIAVKWKPKLIEVEKNFGNGALCSIWRPHLLKEHRCGLEEVWESGQKELRIIDILEPVINNGRLVVDEELVARDWNSTSKHPLEKRSAYSLFFQIARITRERKSLIHDDRVDALAGSVRHWSEMLAQDSMKIVNQMRKKQWADRMRNPLGDGTKIPQFALMKIGLGTSNRSRSMQRMRQR